MSRTSDDARLLAENLEHRQSTTGHYATVPVQPQFDPARPFQSRASPTGSYPPLYDKSVHTGLLQLGSASTPMSGHASARTYNKPTVVQRAQRKWTYEKRQDWWPYETLGWFLGLLCFVAIAAIVGPFEGRQSPSLKWGITLNTVVSILSTIATFALMLPITSALGQLKWIWFTQERTLADFELLDDATRGPLGSLKVLAYRRGGLLVSLGAFLTIAVLAINPFVQQIIATQITAVSAGRTFMPTVMVYDALAYNRSGIFANLWDGMIEPTLASAVLSAIYAPGQIPATVTPDCSTGNCSWPSEGEGSKYQTLAVCSSCVDLTNQSISNSSGFFMPSGFGLVGPGGNAAKYFNISLLNMTALHTETTFGVDQAIDIVPNERFYTSSAFWRNSVGGLSAFALVANATQPLAVECLLNFCVKTLKAIEVNGQLTESLVSSRALNITWLNVGLPPPGEFGPSNDSWLAINDFLTQTLSGWVYALGDSNSSRATAEQEKIPVQWSDNPMNSIYTSLLQPNFSVDALSAAIARSMTINMRKFPRRMIPVPGTISEDKVVIHIVWRWITLPFALTLLTMLLLVLTMRSSRAHAIQPWCNTALSTLFHGLDSSTLDSLGPLTKVSFMQAEAKDMSVALRQENARWRLKAQ